MCCKINISHFIESKLKAKKNMKESELKWKLKTFWCEIYLNWNKTKQVDAFLRMCEIYWSQKISFDVLIFFEIWNLMWL